jgi:hypothetical protein
MVCVSISSSHLLNRVGPSADLSRLSLASSLETGMIGEPVLLGPIPIDQGISLSLSGLSAELPVLSSIATVEDNDRADYHQKWELWMRVAEARGWNVIEFNRFIWIEFGGYKCSSCATAKRRCYRRTWGMHCLWCQNHHVGCPVSRMELDAGIAPPCERCLQHEIKCEPSSAGGRRCAACAKSRRECERTVSEYKLSLLLASSTAIVSPGGDSFLAASNDDVSDRDWISLLRVQGTGGPRADNDNGPASGSFTIKDVDGPVGIIKSISACIGGVQPPRRRGAGRNGVLPKSEANRRATRAKALLKRDAKKRRLGRKDWAIVDGKVCQTCQASQAVGSVQDPFVGTCCFLPEGGACRECLRTGKACDMGKIDQA